MIKYSVFIVLFVLGLNQISAQSMSDYRFIIIPEKFTDFDPNEFQLNFYLKQLLTKKQYEVLSNDSETWPLELKENPCLALKADIKKDRNWGKNSLFLVFNKCNGVEAYSFSGESRIKEFKEGFQEALKKSMQTVQNSMPKEISEFPAEEIVNVIPEGNISSTSVVDSGIELKNGSQIVLLTQLKDGSFTLIDKESATVMATLKPSTKKDIFHAIIQNGKEKYQTIGYYNGSILGLEYLNESETYEITEFYRTHN